MQLETATAVDVIEQAETDEVPRDWRALIPADRIAPGIYFDLPEERYHADPALGSGSIRALAKCPVYYWLDSWMNPLREEAPETPALLFGRALHKIVLEGKVAFERGYAMEPAKEDYPEALVTMDDIQTVLRAIPADERKRMGIKLTGRKDELIGYVKAVDPGCVIYDDILATFAEDCARSGRTRLTRRMYEEVVTSAGYVAAEERVRDAFVSGRPEVSIFWDEDGVPMKARLDYVRLGEVAGQRVVLPTDLKSFANVLDKPPEQAVVKAIASTRLDIQAAAYYRGIARVRDFYAAGQVYGAADVNAEWLDAMCTTPVEHWHWHWCFYEKGAPISLLRAVSPTVVEAAGMEVERALSAYRDYMATFGVYWRFVDPIEDITVTMEDLPKWL